MLVDLSDISIIVSLISLAISLVMIGYTLRGL